MEKITIIHLLHILIISGLLFYISLKKPRRIIPYLLIVFVLVFFYHLYKWFLTGMPIYMLHLHISLFLIYVAYTNPEPNSFVYQLVLLLAFAVLGYHSFYLLKK